MTTQYPSHQFARGEVYGPRATPEAAARVGRIVEHVGAQAELLAAMLREDDAAVLMGHRDDLAPLLVDGPPALDGFHRAHPYRIRPAMRRALAARLRELGREDDARKVESGPPDQPRPWGARLLVAADREAVAVTWSAGSAP